MIPIRNRLDYLQQCLHSVLDQAPPAEEMQIEVVDNSTRDVGTAEFVRKLSGDRVGYFRQPRDLGMAENWNSCIARAGGELIQILHDDDWVAPGFYEAIHTLATEFPAVGLLACRAFFVTEAGDIEALSDRCPALESAGTAPEAMFYRNILLAPAVVVQRHAYERVGGFRVDLQHVLDWEMWLRLITATGAAMVNRPLAYYRDYAGNETAVGTRTGERLADCLHLAELLRDTPGFDHRKFREAVAFQACDLSLAASHRGDLSAASANARIWLAQSSSRQFVSRSLQLMRNREWAFLQLLFRLKIATSQPAG